MFEKALVGSKKYYILISALLFIILISLVVYIYQLKVGLIITGMGRDVSWGLYISQFTYLVGIAAAALMVVLPCYLHNYKLFARITVLGEFMAVAAVVMCILFIFVDLGKPTRVLNVLIHPTPNSVMFWDMIVLSVYLLLNIITGWMVLQYEKNEVKPARWVKVLIYIAIPWAPLIHTVTAFLYAGLPGRGYWLTAIMAPRFLASAFCAGPALLILFALIIRKFSKFDPKEEAIQTLAKIATYALIANVFFFFCELFTVIYSQIPEHLEHFKFLITGLDGNFQYVPLMWVSILVMIIAIILLVIPMCRKNISVLTITCLLVLVGTWIDKGLLLMVGGFVPNPFGKIIIYWPTLPEIVITIGVWAFGALILVLLYKIAISVRREIEL
jgi:molybdopterin-containing oxidoreductase family membrane subunit